LGVVALLLVFRPTAVKADGSGDDEQPAFELTLREAPELPSGKAALVQGDSRPQGDNFFIDNIGVLQPVAVTLIAKTDGDVIKLTLAKDRWDESIQDISTGPGNARVTLKLRTQGELRMIVKADGDPKPYFLVAWVGPEILPDMAPVITPMKDFKGSGGAVSGGGGDGGGHNGLIAVAIVAGVIIVLVLVLRNRGKNR
jgi:hypothetical protein